jgi:hypothetical protein
MTVPILLDGVTARPACELGDVVRVEQVVRVHRLGHGPAA